MLQVLQVQTELLKPQSGAFAHGGGLGRLEMSERQSRLGLVLLREVRQFLHHIHQFLFHQLQRLSHDNNVGVVPHIAGGGPQMDNPRRLGALLPVSVYMAHHIMTHFLFPGPGHFVIDILSMGLQFVNLFLGDHRLAVLGESQFLFSLRQGNPQPPPGAEFHILGKNILHFPAGIAF